MVSFSIGLSLVQIVVGSDMERDTSQIEGKVLRCLFARGTDNELSMFLQSLNSLTLAFNIATNEFLPHLTSKNIDLLLLAMAGSNFYKLALRFYLIITDEGYFPSQRGFEDLMFTLARNSLSRHSVLHSGGYGMQEGFCWTM